MKTLTEKSILIIVFISLFTLLAFGLTFTAWTQPSLDYIRRVAMTLFGAVALGGALLFLSLALPAKYQLWVSGISTGMMLAGMVSAFTLVIFYM
jgi:hypothetical protein